MFHVRQLHLGHLAKAFALRDAPGHITQTQKGPSGKNASRTKPRKAASARGETAGGQVPKSAKRRAQEAEDDHDASAEKRMRDVVRAQGRLSKKGGVMRTTGVSEFQIAGGDDLERIVQQR